MIPVDAFQAAVRAALLSNPVIRQHVAPEHIRVGTMRPAQLPSIVISPTRANVLGRAGGGQIVADVRCIVHVLVSNDSGSSVTQDIGAAAFMALMDAPIAQGLEIDDWERPIITWADQSVSIGNASHGAIALSAIIRWHD